MALGGGKNWRRHNEAREQLPHEAVRRDALPHWIHNQVPFGTGGLPHALVLSLRKKGPKMFAHGRKLPAGSHPVSHARPAKVDAYLIEQAARGAANITRIRSEKKIASSMLWVTNTAVFGEMCKDAGDFALELLARDGIQRAKRVVHQQNVRIERQCPRQPDPLLHAAGNLVRIVAGETIQTHEPQESIGAL